MSVDSLIFWLFVAAWLVVAGLILFVQLPRVVGEARRILKRVIALVDESPVPMQIAKAEADVNRIDRAFARISVLQTRALAAIAVIRDTPLVPPAIGDLVYRIRAEIHEFRRLSR